MTKAKKKSINYSFDNKEVQSVVAETDVFAPKVAEYDESLIIRNLPADYERAITKDELIDKIRIGIKEMYHTKRNK